MSDGHDEFDRLNAMVEPDQQTWDLSPNDVKAIQCVLDTSKRQALKLARIHAYCIRICQCDVADDRQLGERQATEYIKSIIESEVKP